MRIDRRVGAGAVGVPIQAVDGATGTRVFEVAPTGSVAPLRSAPGLERNAEEYVLEKATAALEPLEWLLAAERSFIHAHLVDLMRHELAPLVEAVVGTAPSAANADEESAIRDPSQR